MAVGNNLPARLRRERMLELIRQRDFVHVNEFADAFGISEVTVRSDLDALESRGHLRRVRGGAVPRSVPRPELPFEETRATYAAQKKAIAAAAAAMVSTGDTIILDVGTTTTAVAHALAARTELNDVVVFTSSLIIALELEVATPRITVVVTGGTVRPMQHSLVDPLGELLLDRINAGMVFLGCSGVDSEGGITNVNLPEAQMKRRMLAAARRRIVVADASKLGQVALVRLCDIDDVDLLITSGADPDQVAPLRDAGLDVVDPPPATEPRPPAAQQST